MSNHYRTIHAALLRHCALAARKLTETGLQNVQVVNLDAFTDEAQWPAEDFVGLAEFHLTIDSIYEGSAIVSLALAEDTNLLRSAQYIELMLDDLLPNSNISVVNLTTGEVEGMLLIKGGVQVAPPMATKTRPLIPIMFAFTSNLQAA